MRVRVDEAGGQRLAGGDHLAVGRAAAEVADRDDAVAGDADVGGEARRAGAVEHGGVADDQITVSVIPASPRAPRPLPARARTGFGMCRKNAQTNDEITHRNARPYRPPA